LGKNYPKITFTPILVILP